MLLPSVSHLLLWVRGWFLLRTVLGRTRYERELPELNKYKPLKNTKLERETGKSPRVSENVKTAVCETFSE